MSIQNSIPIDINLGWVDVANFLRDANNDGEGFVQLKLCNILNGEASLLEGNRNSLSRSFGEVNGINPGIGPGCRAN